MLERVIGSANTEEPSPCVDAKASALIKDKDDAMVLEERLEDIENAFES